MPLPPQASSHHMDAWLLTSLELRTPMSSKQGHRMPIAVVTNRVRCITILPNDFALLAVKFVHISSLEWKFTYGVLKICYLFKIYNKRVAQTLQFSGMTSSRDHDLRTYEDLLTDWFV